MFGFEGGPLGTIVINGYTPQKKRTWQAGKPTMNEDVFPIENGGFSNVMLVFRAVNGYKWGLKRPKMNGFHWQLMNHPEIYWELWASTQWLFLVPLKGGRDYITHQKARTISGI